MSLRAFLRRLIWLSLLPLLGVSAYLAVDRIHTAQTQRDRHAADLARNVATAIDRDISAQISALQTLAASPLLDDSTHLDEFYRESSGFRDNFGGQVVLADRSMQMLFNTRVPLGTPLPKLPRPRGHAAAPTALETGAPSVGDSFLGPVANLILVALVVPVTRDGDIKFLLLSVISAKKFQGTFDQFTLVPGWAVTLFDSKGDIVAGQAPPGITPERNVDAGIKRITVPLQTSLWSVALDVPTAQFREQILIAAVILALAVLAATLTGVLGGSIAGRRLARAVTALAQVPVPPAIESSVEEIETVHRLLIEAATARKAAELNELISDKRFSSTFEQAAVGLAYVAPDGRWLRINQKLCSILGYEHDELMGGDFQNVTHSDDLEADLAQVRRVLAGEIKDYTLEKRYIRKDRSIVWIRLTVTLVRDSTGEPDYFISVIEDISERKQAEAAAREARERLSLAVEAGNIGLWEWELAPDGSVPDTLHFSPQAKRMLGYADHEMTDGPGQWAAVLHPDDLTRMQEEATLYHTNPTPSCEYEFRMLPKDGPPITVLSRGQLSYDPDGRPLRLVGSWIDITALRDAERQLQQAQKMEAVGQLTGGVAHDFNNLLTVVLGNLELIANSAKGQPSIEQWASRGIDAAQRGAELTARLLAFSRRQTLDPEVIDLNEVVSAMDSLLRRTLGENIAYEIETSPDLWPTRIDPHQLESAMLNLAINARDAMPRGGKLIVRIANVHFDVRDETESSEAEPGDYVALAMTDNGVGMAPSVAARVFEPFFTTKDVGKGSGLGLSMVHGFVRQSGGHITVKSQPESGTTVTLYFQRSLETLSADASVAEKSSAAGGQETILIVEDDGDVRSIASTMIGGLGYRVLEAEDGTAALAMLKAHPETSLLFTDVVMPGGIRGDELARRAIEKIPTLKILFTSGYPDQAFGQGGRPDGQIDLLRKPYEMTTLAREIRRILDGT